MQQTVSNWFVKFHVSNFDVTNDSRGHPDSKVNIDAIQATEFDSYQSVYELSLKFGVNKQTILIHLAQIRKVKKLDKWVGSP